MKISGLFLSLCLVDSAVAFTAQNPSRSAATGPLHSSLYSAESSVAPRVSNNPNVGFREPSRGNANSFYPPVSREDAGAMQRSYEPTTASRPESRSEPRNRNIWENLTPVTVQGGSLRTWSFQQSNIERVQILMNTEGRPMDAEIDLWEGPDNSPQKMKVYIEDGSVRPFCAVIETPRGQNAIAVRNTNGMEFPLNACVSEVVEAGGNDLPNAVLSQSDIKPETIQGGAIRTFPVPPQVASIKILLKTDGRPLNARVELLQGPNNNKQVIDLYSEDGILRPFFAVIDTPGSANVIRIVNTAPMEFPMYAGVESHLVETYSNNYSGSPFNVY